MKTTKRILSAFLCTLIVMSVFMCAPFSASTVDADNVTKADEITITNGNTDETNTIVNNKKDDIADTAYNDNNSDEYERIVHDGVVYSIDEYNRLYLTGYISNELPEHLVIPKEVNGYPVDRMWHSAFSYCKKLKSVFIPNTITRDIDDYVFQDCVNLESVVFEEGTKIKYLGEWTFAGCKNLKSIQIPASVERVVHYTFEDCVSLETVTFEKGSKLELIGMNSFAGCESLKSIDIPSGCTEICDNAFLDCYNLSEVTLNEGVVEIGRAAFLNCYSLPQIYVPKTVQEIEALAFGCIYESGDYYSFNEFTVLGYPDSLAKQYAEAYNMKYALPAPILSKVENKTDGIKLSFKKLSDVTGKYRVYRKTEGTSWKKLADITTASYTDTTAKAGTKYTYTVKYIGKPANSVYDKDGLSITRLTTPTVSKISNTNDGAKLTIKAVSGAAKYRVYVRSGSSWKSLGTTDTTTFTHTDVKSGTTYKYTVKAYDASSECSSAYKSEGFSNKFVAPPQITKTSNTETGVKITWGKVDGAEKYRVFVKSGSSWKKLKDTTSTSYTHTATESGKAYTYTVRCISSTGKSYKSGYDTTGTKALFLSTPTVTKISNTADGAKLTYTESIGASKYNIYANSGSGWKKIGESTTTTFIHTDAKSGVTYSYRVRAYDETGDYPSYYKTSAKNKFVAAPVISELSNTEKGVKITWGKVDGAEKYRVFVKSGSSWKKLKDTTSTSYTHTNVEDGKTYTYTVRCISSTGKSYKSGYNSTGVSILFEK